MHPGAPFISGNERQGASGSPQASGLDPDQAVSGVRGKVSQSPSLRGSELPLLQGLLSAGCDQQQEGEGVQVPQDPGLRGSLRREEVCRVSLQEMQRQRDEARDGPQRQEGGAQAPGQGQQGPQTGYKF